MALVKDNHVAAAGGVAEAYAKVRALEGTIPVEIEVDTLDGLAAACAAGADLVLIDNFDTDRMRAAVGSAVVIDEPVIAHYGGTVAGPVFRRIAEVTLRHMGIAPEGRQAILKKKKEQNNGVICLVSSL